MLQQPYIFIETNFKRTTQSIWVLALVEKERRIMLNQKTFENMNLGTCLEKVSEIVKEHFCQTSGKVYLWGEIAHYVYHHIDGSLYAFDINGKQLPHTVIKKEITATLDPDITKLFN